MCHIDGTSAIYPPLPANQGLKLKCFLELESYPQHLPTASCKPRIETKNGETRASGYDHLPTASCKPRIETPFIGIQDCFPIYLPTASCKPRIETLQRPI